jgi:hypothetical protein
MKSAHKVQKAQVHTQREMDTKAASAALDALLSANGLLPLDIKGHIDNVLVQNARSRAKAGRGLPAERIKELQDGLKQLQAEGVMGGIKAAKAQQVQADAQRAADTKTASAALDALLSANGLCAVDIKGYIDNQLVHNARSRSKAGAALLADRLQELHDGMKQLQAEGVLKGIKAAKVQQAQTGSQRETDTKVEIAALDALLSANGLLPVDVKGYIDPTVVYDARGRAKAGWGLSAGELAELQDGRKKLQAEGVLEGIAEAAKAQQAQAESHRRTDTKVEVAALDDLLSAKGLCAVDVKGYIGSALVYDARGRAKAGAALGAAKLGELQEGLKQLQAEGVLEGILTAKAQQAQAESQRKTDTKVQVAALEDFISANGLRAADVKGYIGSALVQDARRSAKAGRQLSAAKLEELQQGLKQLQAEGVLEGIAKKAQLTVKRRQQTSKATIQATPAKRRRPAAEESDVEAGADQKRIEGIAALAAVGAVAVGIDSRSSEAAAATAAAAALLLL